MITGFISAPEQTAPTASSYDPWPKDPRPQGAQAPRASGHPSTTEAKVIKFQDIRMIDAFRAFWDKGIKQVSPGALGMTIEARPYDVEKGPIIAAQFSEFCKWDGTWIVLERKPK